MDEKRIDAVENVSASKSAKEMRKGATRVGEIVSLRTAHRKVFRMDDGSEQAVFCSDAEFSGDTSAIMSVTSWREGLRRSHGSLMENM